MKSGCILSSFEDKVTRACFISNPQMIISWGHVPLSGLWRQGREVLLQTHLWRQRQMANYLFLNSRWWDLVNFSDLCRKGHAVLILSEIFEFKVNRHSSLFLWRQCLVSMSRHWRLGQHVTMTWLNPLLSLINLSVVVGLLCTQHPSLVDQYWPEPGNGTRQCLPLFPRGRLRLGNFSNWKSDPSPATTNYHIFKLSKLAAA